MRRRLVHVMLVTGLVVSLFAGLSGSASAQDQYQGFQFDLNEYLPDVSGTFLPWVPNEVALGENSEFHGSVTFQNLEDVPVEADVYIGLGGQFDPDDDDDGARDWELAETVPLAPHESMTLSADGLGIPEGSGASVKILSSSAENGDAEEDPKHDARIVAVVKNVSPTAGDNGMTSTDHAVVDGYSGLTDYQLESDEGTFVLPIVQNNSGWETTVRVAHFGEYEADGDSLTNVTVTLYGSGEQGFAGFSEVVNLQIRPGGVASFELSDYVPDEWVGSAFITSSAPIGAVAERVKSSESMLVTNISRPETQSDNTQYAPLVYKEYNFWNTGISVANSDPNQTNSITITYYGPTNNQVGQDTLTIPPRGMEFVYTPGSQELGLSEGFVGSARIEGTTTFHAAVDQVKYFGDDPDAGQAMSYVAESDPARFYGEGVNDVLAMPLVQKGNPNTGHGDTSGVQLFNVDSENSVEVDITFYGANGLPVAPTVSDNQPDPMTLDLAPNQSYTLYAHELSELSSGFQGSVIVEVVGGDGAVVGVSNNVNYEVAGDGSSAFNLVETAPNVASPVIVLDLRGLDGAPSGALDREADPVIGSAFAVPDPVEGGRNYPEGIRTIIEVDVPGGCIPGWNLGDYAYALGFTLYHVFGDRVVDECTASGAYWVVIEEIPLIGGYTWTAETNRGETSLSTPVGEYTVTARMIDIETGITLVTTTESFTIVAP